MSYFSSTIVEKLDGERKNLSLVYPQDKHAYWLGQISIITPQINYRPYNEMAVRSFSKDCRSGEACNCTKFLSTETRAPTCAERGNIRERNDDRKSSLGVYIFDEFLFSETNRVRRTAIVDESFVLHRNRKDVFCFYRILRSRAMIAVLIKRFECSLLLSLSLSRRFITSLVRLL